MRSLLASLLLLWSAAAFADPAGERQEIQPTLVAAGKNGCDVQLALPDGRRATPRTTATDGTGHPSRCRLTGVKPQVCHVHAAVPCDRAPAAAFLVGPLRTVEGSCPEAIDARLSRCTQIRTATGGDGAEALFHDTGEPLLPCQLDQEVGFGSWKGRVRVVGEQLGLVFEESCAQLMSPPAPVAAPAGPSGVDGATISQHTAAHRGAIRYCYEKELKRNPALSGRVSLQFVIGPDGTVTSVRIASSTMNSPPVEDCLRRVLKSWTFPKPTGGGSVTVTYPFGFSPSGSE